MQQTKLIGKQQVAEGTTEFIFEKPDGFVHKAGQTLDLTLIDPPETDTEGNSRTFSIASAPHEKNLAIATRMRDTAFKRVLGNLAEGTHINLDGPFGSFTLHENAKRSAVLLAGGIGITPFRSIIADAAERALPHKILLFYSNRRPEDVAFLAELTGFAKKDPNFTLIATMTEMEKSKESWEGERGYVDAAMLGRHIPADSSPIYYLAGPQGMVLALRDILTGTGISMDDIRYEEFAGY